MRNPERDRLYVSPCWKCGNPLAITREVELMRRADGSSVWCSTCRTSGSFHHTKEEKETYKRKLDAIREDIPAPVRVETKIVEVATPTPANRRRACPVCGKRYKGMAGHIRRMHPDYKKAGGGEA